MKKIILIILSLFFSACFDDGKTLKVGVVPNYFPFEFKDKQEKLSGFDIELIEELSKRLNLKIKWETKYEFNELIPALLDKKIDLISSSLFITPERLKLIDFTRAYYFSKNAYLKNKNDENIKTKLDLKGKIIGVRKGSSQEQILKKYSDIKIMSLEEIDKLFRLLNEGKIDAVIADNSIIAEYLNLYKNIAVFYYEKGDGNGYGFGIRKEDKILNSTINSELMKMQEDKSLQKLINKYNLP